MPGALWPMDLRNVFVDRMASFRWSSFREPLCKKCVVKDYMRKVEQHLCQLARKKTKEQTEVHRRKDSVDMRFCQARRHQCERVLQHHRKCRWCAGPNTANTVHVCLALCESWWQRVLMPRVCQAQAHEYAISLSAARDKNLNLPWCPWCHAQVLLPAWTRKPISMTYGSWHQVCPSYRPMWRKTIGILASNPPTCFRWVCSLSNLGQFKYKAAAATKCNFSSYVGIIAPHLLDYGKVWALGDRWRCDVNCQKVIPYNKPQPDSTTNNQPINLLVTSRNSNPGNCTQIWPPGLREDFLIGSHKNQH